MSKLKSGYSGALWAMERQFRQLNENVNAQIKALRGEVEKELGFAARLNARTLGPLLLWTSRREERQLAKGKTYEPPTFLERTNWVTA
jgi:hypothetical protein